MALSDRLAEIRKRLSNPDLVKYQACPEVALIVIHDTPFLLAELDKALKLLSLAAEFKLNAKWSQDVRDFVHSHGMSESWESLSV